MSEQLKEAVQMLRRLPEGLQNTVARAIIEYATALDEHARAQRREYMKPSEQKPGSAHSSE